MNILLLIFIFLSHYKYQITKFYIISLFNLLLRWIVFTIYLFRIKGVIHVIASVKTTEYFNMYWLQSKKALSGSTGVC